MKTVFLLLMSFVAIYAKAQFAPAPGYTGTTAISKDTSLFVEWATGCTVQRGYMDIAVPDSGYASVGNETSAIGAAGQAGVVSLGDSGIAMLTFAHNIYNGPGYDFAVFENGFYTGAPSAFLELAFVEVSSNGVDFFRFPATSNVQDTTQMAMAGSDCQLINNLAGKYVFGFGTPFDLEELKDEVGLDVMNITHVRLIDVVGTIGAHATYDQHGNKVNDPYPTLFPSGGFDLDAVGVIYALGITSVEELIVTDGQVAIYPNPSAGNAVHVKVTDGLIGQQVSVCDVTGKKLVRQTVFTSDFALSTSNFSKGLYFVTVGNQTTKLLIE
ncbi:MAG TPA: T9SS type A sorting domain-containing protein [Chitinophagales bacterium]|nr:T9SS type A sorting domain-containing protein [Chitinophagales bacterium]